MKKTFASFFALAVAAMFTAAAAASQQGGGEIKISGFNFLTGPGTGKTTSLKEMAEWHSSVIIFEREPELHEVVAHARAATERLRTLPSHTEDAKLLQRLPKDPAHIQSRVETQTSTFSAQDFAAMAKEVARQGLGEEGAETVNDLCEEIGQLAFERNPGVRPVMAAVKALVAHVQTGASPDDFDCEAAFASELGLDEG